MRPRDRVVVVAVLALIAVEFLRVSPANPPGFFRDESAIAYNAYTLATTGRDEYGARLPTFIRSFDDYKSPLYVYLLAGVYRVSGLSLHVAREFSAVLGLAAVLVLYALALSLTRRQLPALGVAVIAGLTPWLFETSRLVFEVALMPLVIALLLFAVHRASSRTWTWRHSVSIGLLLGALAYTYQVGRVIAPLLAIGLLVCWYRGPWRQLGLVWAVFLVAVTPILAWSQNHPGALSARYHVATYIHSGMSRWEIAKEFLVHYARNMDIWHWVTRGDTSEIQHVRGAGSLFFVEVALALVGLAIVLSRRRGSPWWRFVLIGVLVSPVGASLTSGTFPAGRMAALTVYVPLLTLPALETVDSLPGRARLAPVAALLAVFAGEEVHWQIVFARNGPHRTTAFEADARPLIDAALRTNATVYAFRSAHGPYIDTLLYGTLAKRPAGSYVVLDPRSRPPAGALVVGTVGECPQCRLVSHAGAFETFRYVPARPAVLRTSFQLNSPIVPLGQAYQFLVELDNTGSQPADHVTLVVKLPSGIELSAPPYHERGTCDGTTTTTITCDLGYIPAKVGTVIRYQVVVNAAGPQTMTAVATSADLTLSPAGTASAFTIDETTPAYARKSTPPARVLCAGPIVICPL